MKNKIYRVAAVLTLAVFLSGCGTMKKARRTDELEVENQRLKRQLEMLEKDKGQIVSSKVREVSQLERAKAELERQLKKEIGEYKAKLEMSERGLVITFLDEIFFDSGKDVIREEGKESLQKVAAVLNEELIDTTVAVEGHTDNIPIKYSGWKSNWELSSARAMAVVHYFIDECKVAPQRLSGVGYGEYKPVVPNDTPEGRQQNRRVEIVILPSKVTKVRP